MDAELHFLTAVCPILHVHIVETSLVAIGKPTFSILLRYGGPYRGSLVVIWLIVSGLGLLLLSLFGQFRSVILNDSPMILDTCLI